MGIENPDRSPRGAGVADAPCCKSGRSRGNRRDKLICFMAGFKTPNKRFMFHVYGFNLIAFISPRFIEERVCKICRPDNSKSMQVTKIISVRMMTQVGSLLLALLIGIVI